METAQQTSASAPLHKLVRTDLGAAQDRAFVAGTPWCAQVFWRIEKLHRPIERPGAAAGRGLGDHGTAASKDVLSCRASVPHDLRAAIGLAQSMIKAVEGRTRDGQRDGKIA